MSFIQDPSVTLYTSNHTIDSSVFPNKYLPSFYQINSNNRTRTLPIDDKINLSRLNENIITDKNRNSIHSNIPLTHPWYQPGSIENQALLNNYGITNNQQYRKYMTNNSLDICKFNHLSFIKTIQ
jgi:hypothetical protein